MNAGRELYVRAGRNNRFTEIAGAMGISQLRCLPDFLLARRRAAAVYDGVFRDGPFFHPLLAGPGAVPSYWRYTLVAERPFDRPALRDRLAARGIQVDWPYEPLLHLQPSLRALYGGAAGERPISEDLASRHLCLPMHARLRDEDALYVAESVRDEAKRLGGKI
jgi:dTDP-4-amino-4,6-dideoxygalactose transaminase